MTVTSEFEQKKYQARGYIAAYYNAAMNNNCPYYSMNSLDWMISLYELIFDESISIDDLT